MLCWLLPYADTSRPQVCMCPLRPRPPAHPLGGPRAPGWSPLRHMASSHRLFHTRWWTCFRATPSVRPSSPPLRLHCCPEHRLIRTIFLHVHALIHNSWSSPSGLFLSITGSRFTHFIGTDSNVLIFTVEWYPLVYMHQSFFLHSSAGGHLG